MTLILSGTDGLSDIDGSAATPAIRGTDANTGIFFPAADTIAFSEGGTEAMRIDSSGNVGIGTSSPGQKLEVAGNILISTSGNPYMEIKTSGAGNNPYLRLTASTTYWDVAGVFSDSADPLQFSYGGSEKMRLDSSGNLLVGTTTGAARVYVKADAAIVDPVTVNNTNTTANSQYAILFVRNSSTVGSIQTTNSATSYNTSSDYRLKENIAPMTGALATVAALKPCTYTWKVDGSAGQGFIAHELAEVVPDCVTGEKDAVDANGNPVYQGIDTSFLVATLTAAIQELKAINDAQAQTIQSLTARIEALEGK